MTDGEIKPEFNVSRTCPTLINTLSVSNKFFNTFMSIINPRIQNHSLKQGFKPLTTKTSLTMKI